MNQKKSTQFEAVIGSLYARINYERQLKVTPRHFKLQNMREFLDRLGNPHLDYPVVHVAGTKGKGSVATMVGKILEASDRRTGVYTSPHLESIHQRMAVDGKTISDQQLVDVLMKIEPVADLLDLQSGLDDRRPLTFFEVTTAAAFEYFSQQSVDAAVLEVGLGGRLDSTNVCQPVISVITNISFDHTRQLGSTLDKIAFEKAGIIKPGVPVVSGAIEPLAATTIEEVACQRNAPLYLLERDFEVRSDPQRSDRFSVAGTIEGRNFEYRDLELGMIGRHQQTNAAIAVMTMEVLNELNWNVSSNHVHRGLAAAQLAGRTEILSRQPLIIVDIAHNVASAAALAETLAEQPDWQAAKSRTLVVATTREKDVDGMLRELLPQFDRVVCTKYQKNPRGKPATELYDSAAEIIRELADNGSLKHEIELSMRRLPEDALAVASDQPTDAICIAGSAFLIAELRPLVLTSTSV